MIQWNANNELISFSFQECGNLIPFSDWKNYEEGEIYAYLLEEFVDNGLAVVTDCGCSVAYDAIYKMTGSERNVLNLPPLYPYKIDVNHKGQLDENDFVYKIVYCKNKLGKRFKSERNGAVLKADNELFLLNSHQFELVKAIEDFNLLSAECKSFNENLTHLNRIKLAAKQDENVLLDRYLESENVFVPKVLKIDVNPLDDDTFELVPSIHNPLSEQFDRYLSTRNVVPDNVALSPENSTRRVRVVLDENKRKSIQTIRDKYSRATSAQLKELVENPVGFLDPEHCDLSVFYSDRVIKIGLYRPKVYPFVSPYQSDWIPPTYEVEDKINGNSKLSIRSEEELQAFVHSIHTAVANDEASVSFKNIQLYIADAQQMARDAQRKFDLRKEKEEKKVLIVEDNAESLGYSESFIKEEKREDYHFYPIPRLHPDITLRAHQMEGIAWMQDLVLHKERGCLLADDMGLGKTIQLLSLIDWFDKSHPNNRKPYLIVAPVSLLENWEKEYRKFFVRPRIPIITVDAKVAKHYGKGIDEGLITYLQNHQIVLTNYETVRGYQLSFCAVKFSIVVLDETQKIKKPGTLITNAMKALQGDFKIAMTGTPVENTMVDLWCIMDFAVPGLLGNCKEFAAKYQSPLKSLDTDIVELGKQVRKDMGKYFLRRLKSDVAKDLPDKDVEILPAEMSALQLDMYKEVIQQALETRASGNPPQGYMLTCIHHLRLVSDHPYIGEDAYKEESVETLIHSSAKMKAIMPVLERIRDRQEKVIIFSERRAIQKILQRILRVSFAISAHIINGDTSTKNSGRFQRSRMSRQEAIDDFQSKNGFNVIIMSPVAAGMGLNVTGANHVIHYTRHWNPAKESQATDRCYRIGQDKDVHVYYPMAVSSGMITFDQTLDELLKRKMSLAEATLYPSGRINIGNIEEMFDELTKGGL